MGYTNNFSNWKLVDGVLIQKYDMILFDLSLEKILLENELLSRNVLNRDKGFAISVTFE